MLYSEGWGSVIKPHLLKLRDSAIVALIQPQGERKFTDDYTKGQINVLNWMIGWDARVEAFAQELAPPPQDNPDEANGSGTIYSPSGEPTSSAS